MNKLSFTSAFLLIFVILPAGFIFSQQSKNLSLTGHLPYSVPLNDIWAYADSLGNEYALVGAYDGFSIVDLSDPSSPAEIQFISGPQSIWRDIKVFGHYAYVSNETANGILIVDLSGLPSSVLWKEVIIGGATTTHNLWIEDGYMYQSGFNATGGMVISDLNPDPWNPVYTGTYNARYVHDVYVRGNWGYTAEIFDGFLTVLDLTDKSAPVQISNTDWVNSFTHNTWLNDAGDVCFTTDELNKAYVYAWDVSDPTDVVQLDRIRSSLSRGQAAPHNVHVLNDFLITSYYADGIQLVDASRPGNLVEVGYFDTSPRTGPGLVGCWGAYPFLPSGLILATDMEQGLFVLQPNYLRAAHLEGIISESGSGIPLSGVTVELDGTSIQTTSSTSGKYALGTSEPATYQVYYTKPGYRQEVRTLSLSNGQVHIENVQLTALQPGAFSLHITDKDTGSPLSGVKVKLVSPSDTFSLSTDANGDATISGIPSGGYKFSAGKWGWETDYRRIQVEPAAPVQNIELTRGYYDDFNFDFSWLSFGTARQGNWIRTQPYGTFSGGRLFNPDFDSPKDPEDHAFITGNNKGNALRDDVEGGTAILLSPNMDLSALTDPVISFDIWYANQNLTGSDGNDTLVVELIAGGSAFEIARFSGHRDYWDSVSIRIRDYATPGPVNYIRLTVTETLPEDITEAGIDFFRVVETATTGLADEYHPANLKLYPVPVNDRLSISCDLPLSKSTDLHFSIWDVQGKKLADFPLYPRTNQWSVPFNFPAGIYLGTLESGGSRMAAQKIVKY
ncbi:MAG: choice-of-anchor B family protein [Bacteroidia bacterium]